MIKKTLSLRSSFRLYVTLKVLSKKAFLGPICGQTRRCSLMKKETVRWVAFGRTAHRRCCNICLISDVLGVCDWLKVRLLLRSSVGSVNLCTEVAFDRTERSFYIFCYYKMDFLQRDCLFYLLVSSIIVISLIDFLYSRWGNIRQHTFVSFRTAPFYNDGIYSYIISWYTLVIRNVAWHILRCFQIEQSSSSPIIPLDIRTGFIVKTLSLERRQSCHLLNQGSCGRINKSLVISFWSNASYAKWVPKNIYSAFPSNRFDHIIMLHDDTNWSSHPGYRTFVWIRVANQVRFWYIKRFLPPHVLRAYDYVWIIDDDARLTFSPLTYECVVKKLKLPFSSPTRLSGPAFHRITWQDTKQRHRIGRWTDFLEIGPVVVGEGSIWACLWHYLLPVVGAGYGLDYVWCRIISEKCLPIAQRDKACGMLDVFGIHHDSKGLSGAGNRADEKRAHGMYKNFTGRKANIDFLSEGTDVVNECNSTNV